MSNLESSQGVSNLAPTRKRAGLTDREHAGLKARAGLGVALLELAQRIGWSFRRKRLQQFEKLFPETEYGDLLDVGGTFTFWEGTIRKVTIVNPLMQPGTVGNVACVPGDGRKLPFKDKSFSLVFSNSVIEHMSKSDMKNFASELIRVGRAVYCQTPNRWFPYDTHYIAFFWHWWPRLLHNYFIARYLTGWGWVFKPDRKHVEEWANEVNLLGEKDLRSLFPDCRIEEERFLGMTKSFVVIRST
jgi:hypothetical protein